MNGGHRKISVLHQSPFDRLRANGVNQSFLKLDIQGNSHGIHGTTRKKEAMKEHFSVLFRGFRGYFLVHPV
jgi:hypothetical protein